MKANPQKKRNSSLCSHGKRNQNLKAIIRQKSWYGKIPERQTAVDRPCMATYSLQHYASTLKGPALSYVMNTDDISLKWKCSNAASCWLDSKYAVTSLLTWLRLVLTDLRQVLRQPALTRLKICWRIALTALEIWPGARLETQVLSQASLQRYTCHDEIGDLIWLETSFALVPTVLRKALEILNYSKGRIRRSAVFAARGLLFQLFFRAAFCALLMHPGCLIFQTLWVLCIFEGALYKRLEIKKKT